MWILNVACMLARWCLAIGATPSPARVSPETRRSASSQGRAYCLGPLLVSEQPWKENHNLATQVMSRLSSSGELDHWTSTSVEMARGRWRGAVCRGSIITSYLMRSRYGSAFAHSDPAAGIRVKDCTPSATSYRVHVPWQSAEVVSDSRFKPCRESSVKTSNGRTDPRASRGRHKGDMHVGIFGGRDAATTTSDQPDFETCIYAMHGWVVAVSCS